MTTIETVEAAEASAVTLARTFEVELAGDGRTLETRLVPYNVPATVADPPDFTPYRELFLPGAFERQAAAPDRVKVWLNFEHEQGLRGIVGHGVALEDRADGLYGSFRVHENSDGDKALQLVQERVVDGLSLEFFEERSRRVGGVTQRIKARVDKVSLCRFPAYDDARVLAVREQPPPVVPPATFVPPVMAADLAGRLEAIGVAPLQRVAVSQKPWDGSPARFSDEQWQQACLVDRGGDGPVKERCVLPVLEPLGTLNANALAPATAQLGRTRMRRSERSDAARLLVRYYGAAGMDAPAGLKALARS